MSVQTTGAEGTVEHYRMPDAGEGLTEAEVVTWRVAVGDVVDVNDIVVEVETAKSLVELPCPFAGTVVELMAEVGDTVAVGTPILAVRTDDGGGATQPQDDGEARAAGPTQATDPGATTAGADPGADAHPAAGRDEGAGEPAVGDAAPADDTGAPVGPSAVTAAHPSTQAAAGAGRTAVLVGYGPAAGATRRRARRPASGAGAETARVPAADRSSNAPEPPAGDIEQVLQATGGHGARVKVLAKPPVRKLAKDLGVDLDTVTPTGPGGVVSRADVEAAAEGGAAGSAAAPGSEQASPDWTTAWAEDDTTRVPVKGVRKHTAEAMVASAFTAPHVTEWVQVDVTESIRLLERLKGDRALRDLRLSPFTLVARAMCIAARRHRMVNVSWDETAREIVVHRQVNLGIAAATERGLVVPVVDHADSRDLAGLAGAIAELVDTARAGRLQPAQQSGVTLTVTNVGVFGVDGGTPILPPATGLILACGQVRRMPWVVGTGADEQVVPRDVMTLSASFDHRMIDGELGSRYLADVARLLQDPGYGLAWT